jgi:hypothetical protein
LKADLTIFVKSFNRFSLLVVVAAVLSVCAWAAPLELSMEKVRATDAVVSRGDGGVLRVETGTKHEWPGVAIVAPEGHWDLSRFGDVEVSLKNTGTQLLKIACRVDNAGANGKDHCVNGKLELQPGAVGTVRVPLWRTRRDNLGGKLFGMRGTPFAAGGPYTVDASRITQVLVFTPKPGAARAFEITGFRAAGSYTPPTAFTNDADPYFPFIDTFGQYRHRDWPGKVHSLDELRARRDEEAKELASQPGPAEWNQYGGWKDGPQMKATGFFRTEKYDGKWWLVDPEGRLFFSHGIDSVGTGAATVIGEREQFFEDFPGAQPEFAAFVSKEAAIKGHFAGRKMTAFSFGGANLARKYGADWRSANDETTQRRLRSWGVNTLGMWSDTKVREMRRTPYTDSFGSWGVRTIAGSEGYWGKFPDPFDPSFREKLLKQMEAKRGKSVGDPWCLGFFSDNELSWGDDTSLAIGTLMSPAAQPAKRAFLMMLRKKYDDIAKLNTAWGSAHASWDSLAESTKAPDTAKARPDLTAFYKLIAEEYFRVAREVIKQVAPGQLYLGCRFAWDNPLAQAAAAKFCDVVSFNLYYKDLADFVFEGGADVPLIVGEFHFGATDRGMFHGGLRQMENQAERVEFYAKYVRTALRDPKFVGCHWFQYRDQPTTGRALDEENFQIGFVDIADTPYREMIEASRALSREMYRLRAGR